jgi:hypothetical protein
LLLSDGIGPDYPVVYLPYYVDQRMSAQSSYFMVWGNRNEPLERLIPEENWMVLSNKTINEERGYGKSQAPGILLKLSIYNDKKLGILRQLDMLGINQKTLFPGLDGIGKYIEKNIALIIKKRWILSKSFSRD